MQAGTKIPAASEDENVDHVERTFLEPAWRAPCSECQARYRPLKTS